MSCWIKKQKNYINQYLNPLVSNSKMNIEVLRTFFCKQSLNFFYCKGNKAKVQKTQDFFNKILLFNERKRGGNF